MKLLSIITTNLWCGLFHMFCRQEYRTAVFKVTGKSNSHVLTELIKCRWVGGRRNSCAVIIEL